jgi:hypothetical protein
MNEVEKALYKTRKSVLEVIEELDYNDYSEAVITLKCCSSCGIWLPKMKLDLDGLDICNYCLDAYGP